MSLVTELSGENAWCVIGGVNYKVQGSLNINYQVRDANARGSGDATPRPKAIGLADGAMMSGALISSNRNLWTLHGTEVTGCDAKDDTTTILGAHTCRLAVTESDDVGGMVTFNVELTPLTMPAVLAHLDY